MALGRRRSGADRGLAVEQLLARRRALSFGTNPGDREVSFSQVAII
jgi:hypothetical protein